VCWNKKNQRWQTAINTQGKCVSHINSDPLLLCILQRGSRVALVHTPKGQPCCSRSWQRHVVVQRRWPADGRH
jgi:hypothetical protein